MKKSLFVAAALLALTAIPASAASNHAAFCAGWHKMCVNGKPGEWRGCSSFNNTAACKQICASRQASCQETGCFPFNKGGNKCDGKA